MTEGRGKTALRAARAAAAAAMVALSASLAALAAAGPAGAADPVARDVATAAGLVYPGRAFRQSYGKSPIFDYDGDGDLDVLLSSHLEEWPLMQNRGDGTFRRVLAGTFFAADRHSCVAADFGSAGGTGRPDGRPDVYCATGSCKGTCRGPNHLFLQRPDRTFVEVGAAWGVADVWARGRDAVALDHDRDGLLDLVVGNVTPSARPSPDRLFRNAGGRFRLVTATSINRETGSGCLASGDLDGDSWVDLVACGKSGAAFYRNDRGAFRDITATVPAPLRGTAWQLRLADLNGDRRPDLLRVQGRRVEVWLNRGGGRFPAVASYSRPLREGYGAAVGDVNLDGRPDVYVVQGSNATVDDLMLVNDGGGVRFRAIPVPQVRAGDGDAVETFPNWRGTGRAAFLVTNGRLKARGPVQLIAFSDR